jgi:predicted porin
MNKKLLAVAVAGALAAPGVALAQASSVTISGFFKVGLESHSYSNSPTTRLNKSQMRVVDNSSRIIFNSVEDLGNGLAAVGQLDVRFSPDQAGAAPTSNPIGSGNTFVGLKSNSWGMLTLGRWDLHYGKAPDDTTAKAGALQAAAISLFDYIQTGPNTNVGVANATRTQNVVKYDSPNFSGFAATVAWSGNPVGNTEADMTNPAPAGGSSRKGDGWNINPSYTNGPFQIGYSYWRAKPDAPVAATNDQRGDSVYGYYKFGDFKIGLGWNKSKLNNAITGQLAAERTAWSLPASYTWGPNQIVGHYTRAGNVKDSTGTINDTGARMIALAYVYDLSKRTSLAATYAQINNDTNASYNFFTSNSLGSTDTVITSGEDARLFQLSVQHKF